MTIEEQILTELKELRSEVAHLRTEVNTPKSDWCSPEEALKIIGIKNPRHLKKLHDLGALNRNKIGKEFRYMRSDCIKCSMNFSELLKKL